MPAQPKQTRTQKTNNEAIKPLDDPNLRYQIERRAHEIWLSSGGDHGNDVAHWLQAENEVMAGRQKNPDQTL